MGGYYDSPEITCNVSQSSVDREKSVGFFLDSWMNMIVSLIVLSLETTWLMAS